MNDFKDKVAIVTGAGSGIGKALADQLLENGANVVFADIDAERINTMVNSMGFTQDRLKGIQLDVSDFKQVSQLVQDTLHQHGRIDYMFNNAGIVIGGEARDCSIEDWQRVINVDLMGVVNGVAAVYPKMVSQGFGHIVNTASIEGLLPFPGTISYVTSKFGVVGLSRALRIEGKGLGVKVSAVCPGYIRTQIFYDCKMINIDRQKLLEKLPEKTGMTPEKCAAIILKGVRRNKGLIVVTGAAKIAWWAQRLFPRVVEFLMERSIAQSRKEIRINS